MLRSKGTILVAGAAAALAASVANWSWAEPAGADGVGGSRAPVYLAQRVRVRRRSVEYTQGQPRQEQNRGYTYADRQMAACLIVDNENEIAAARLAEERSQNKEVREFAVGIRGDHQKLLDQLRPIAGNLVQPVAQAGQRADQRAGQTANQPGGQDASQPRGQTANQPQAVRSTNNGLDFVRIKQEIGAQCRATMQRELREKDASEFDKAFVGMQIGKHYELLDTLMVLSHHASPGFDKLIENAEEVTHSHLDHAKRLMKSLDSDRSSSDRSARRDPQSSSSLRGLGNRDSD